LIAGIVLAWCWRNSVAKITKTFVDKVQALAEGYQIH